jgi:hypothetical protein
MTDTCRLHLQIAQRWSTVPQEHVFPVRFYSSLRSHRTGSGNRRFVAFVLRLKEETLEWRTRANSRYMIRRPKPRGKKNGGHIIHSFTNRDDLYTSYLGVEYSFVFEPWSKTCGWAGRLACWSRYDKEGISWSITSGFQDSQVAAGTCHDSQAWGGEVVIREAWRPKPALHVINFRLPRSGPSL